MRRHSFQIQGTMLCQCPIKAMRYLWSRQDCARKQAGSLFWRRFHMRKTINFVPSDDGVDKFYMLIG